LLHHFGVQPIGRLGIVACAAPTKDIVPFITLIN